MTTTTALHAVSDNPDHDPLRITEADGFDPHWLDKNREAGRAHCANPKTGVPWIFRNARVEHPDMVAWVAEVLAEAVTAYKGRPNPKAAHGPLALMVGYVGRGKTHAAYGALRALSASGISCPWVAVTGPDLYPSLRPRSGVDSEAVMDRYLNAPVLLIDEFGATKTTEFTEEVNWRIVDYRTRHYLPTLLTTNATSADLEETLGESLVSRLATARRVVFKGVDRRMS